MADTPEDVKTPKETVTTPEDIPAEEIPQTSGNDAVLLVRIEEMIKTHISQMDELSGKIQEHKEMLDDIFKNDETFQEHDKIAKEASRIRGNTKKEIMKRPAVADLDNKMKSLKSEKAELEDGLSDYLREYQRLSGSNQIEGEDGEMREIIFVPKLVKKGAYRP
jgi:hypothetical protein